MRNVRAQAAALTDQRRARRLLKLYPRAWRVRYGDEFLALLGDGPLTFKHTIDVVSGAVDARLTGWRSTPSDRDTASQGGAPVLQMLKRACHQSPRVSTGQARIGAAIMLGVSLVGAAGGLVLNRYGFDATGDFILYISFFVGLQLSALATYLKGQPRRVQLVMAGGPLVLVAGILGAAMWVSNLS